MTDPLLLHVYPTFDIGGVQRRLSDLINAWGSRYRHAIVSLDGGQAALDLLTEPNQIRFVDTGQSKGGLIGLPQRLTMIRRQLRAIRPDVLLTFNFGAIEWALANRLSDAAGHVHFEEGFGVEESPERQIRRRVWLRRAALTGRHTTTIVVSKVLEDLAKRVWRLPDDKVAYVPNGIHLDRYTAGKPAANTWRTGDEDILITVLGGLRPEKNVARLIDAIARYYRAQRDRTPNVRLIVAGDGPERATLEAQTERLSLKEKVRFIGFVTHPEKLLRKTDILAVSSDHEQMPLSVMEAMAAGLPIVSTDVGDVRDMVAAENRPFVVALDQSGATLADAIARLTGDRAAMRNIGALNAAKAASAFTFTRMADSTSALIDNAARR